MAAVLCSECNWPVSPSAAECGRCRAPIWVANPPPPVPQPPPATHGRVIIGGVVTVIAVSALFYPTRNDVGTLTDLALRGSFAVPETRRLVRKTIRMPACRHDWRACADNRDWAENNDWSGPRGACVTLAEGASRSGHFAWDRPWNRPKFDIYVSGASIRRGYIVLVDRGALVRDTSGGWVRTPYLHCTFDLAAGKVRSLALP